MATRMNLRGFAMKPAGRYICGCQQIRSSSPESALTAIFDKAPSMGPVGCEGQGRTAMSRSAIKAPSPPESCARPG